MKRLFLSFLVFSSIIFSKHEEIPSYQIDVSSIFQNKSKNLVNTSIYQNVSSVVDNYAYVVWQMAKEERICHQQYQMSLQQKRYLLSHCYGEIVQVLVNQKNLSDEQIWLLWQEYKNKRCWDWSNEKVYAENDLKDGLEKRKRDRRRQEQADERRRADDQKGVEHQKLLQKYDPKILQNSDYVSPYQDHRQQALQQTINDGGKKHTKTHDVDVQTKAFMQTQGIDYRQFESLSGTIFSHQLFGECAEHYKKAAKVVYEYGLKNSVIIPHLLEFTKAAFVGTQHEQFALAVTLSDIAEILAESSLRICKGVIESSCDLIDIVRHPKELAKSLCLAMRFLGGSLSAYDNESAAGSSSLVACKQAFDGDLVVFNQICNASREYFNQWYQKSTQQDKVQAASKLFADAFITPIVVGKAMKACGGILYQAKEAVNFAKAIELAEELGLGFMEAEELLFLTEAGIQKLPATVAEMEIAVTNFVESEIGIAKNSGWFSDVYSVQSFVENIQNIRLQNGFYKNKSLQKETIKYFGQYVYKNELLEFCKDIERTHSSMMVKYLGEEAEMLCRPKHIVLPELDFKTLTKLQNTEAFISGGHTELGIQKLQESNLIKVILQEDLFGGCKGLEIEHVFGKRTLDKSIWPAHWSAEQIMNSIKEAWHNPIFFKETIKEELHFLRIVGIDKSGIKVEMFLNKLSAKKFKLKTAYPYWESKAGLNL